MCVHALLLFSELSPRLGMSVCIFVVCMSIVVPYTVLLTVPNTSLPANATQGSYNAWPVVSVYSSAGLPALPWAPTPIAGTCPGQGVWA